MQLRLWGKGLLLGLCLAVVLSGCGQKRTISKLDKEPAVTVVDKTTGAKKELPIEEYVMGVVGGEMGKLPVAGQQESADWPENAYAAQAILARSFTMKAISQIKGSEISTDVEEAQAYNPDNITPVIKRAVEKTRGEVLTTGGDYAETWFHSYSGGKTATAQEGLNYQGSAPHTKSVELPPNQYVPKERKAWTVTFPVDEVSTALQNKGVNVGQLTGIEVVETGPSGRATQIKVTGTGGSQTIHGNDFRLAVGAEKMQSTLLDKDGLQIAGGQVKVSGTGFGHGVGLSQWDAYKMAKDGKSPEEIVTTFFKDVQIEKAWD